MIASMPPLRIWWPTSSAFELDHGVMGMPRAGSVVARTHTYPLSSAPNGIAEVHIEHWSASTSTFTDVGKTKIGSNDGTTNGDRSAYITWVKNNPTLAAQYAHRRVRRFDSVDGKDSSGNSVVPDPAKKGDEIIEIKINGAVFATGLRRAVSGGSRVLWKLSDDLLQGPEYEFAVGASASNLSAQDFIDNNSGDPGHIASVKHAYWEDVQDFPNGPGTGGSNVPQD